MDTTALAERLAQEIRRVDGSHSLGAAALAEALVPFVESLRAVAGEPVAWMFQHDETGRMTICPNDGVNTPKVFAELNPRYALIEPLYTRPQPATPATVTDEDVERAQEAADLVFAKHFGTRPNADEIDTAMTRAALESFANKEPTDE